MTGLSEVCIVYITSMSICLLVGILTHINLESAVLCPQRLVEQFNFHMYDNPTVPLNKTDPRRYKGVHQVRRSSAILLVAKSGDATVGCSNTVCAGGMGVVFPTGDGDNVNDVCSTCWCSQLNAEVGWVATLWVYEIVLLKAV